MAAVLIFRSCLTQQVSLSCLWVVLCASLSDSPLSRAAIRSYNTFVEIAVAATPQVALLLPPRKLLQHAILVGTLPAICWSYRNASTMAAM